MRKAVIVFLRKDDSVLLLHSWTDPSGAQIFWQGVSGFVDEAEEPPTAALREVREELALSADPAALIERHQFEANGIAFTVFTLDRWDGVPEPHEAGIEELRWFSVDQLPFGEMHPTDREWLPTVLKER